MKFCLVLLFSLIANIAGDFKADPPFYIQRFAGQGGVRALWVDPNGDLLSQARSEIQIYWEEPNGDGTIDVVTRTLIDASSLGLNHQVAWHDGFLYASSGTTVYRWPYTPGSRNPPESLPEVVISNIPGQGHDSRPLAFDNDGNIYVTVGSLNNVDENSDRARVRRFPINGNYPMDFAQGEVFADGLRNESGLTFYNGVLYGVENGADQLNHPEFGDIHNDNPAEELNKFDKPSGQHYGYPYCFSTHTLMDYPKGTQFAWPGKEFDDEWCKNTDNNQPPLIAMPAHCAPLGIEFFKGQSCGENGAFPCSMEGNVIVAQRGSWNRDFPSGYKVVMYPFNNGNPTGEEVTVAYDDSPPGNWRPVNAVFNQNGHLLVSADSQGHITKITYGSPPPTIRTVRNLD